MKKILFTDLDGTLLDLKSYSFIQTIEAIKRLKSMGIPVIFCSSKTRSEQEFYRQSLGINDPFIVENGSAIYIPHGYFEERTNYNAFMTNEYEVIPLGQPVQRIRETLKDFRKRFSLNFSYYDDLPPEDVSMLTGLNVKLARRAMERDYSETILRGQLNRPFYTSLDEHGLRSIPGSKFETVVGKEANKGKAVEILLHLYKKAYGEITSYAIGDSVNDEEMLVAVDHPYLVQRPGGEWAPIGKTSVKGVMGVGPLGWRKVAGIITS